MHILYLHQYFVPPDGSGGIRSYELASRLIKMGHEVTLITTEAQIPKKYLQDGSRSFSVDGIKIVVLPVKYSNKMSYLRRIIAFLLFAGMATIETIKHKADIIYATSTPLTIIIPAAFAKFIKRRPLVFEVRDLWPEMPIAMGVLQNPLLVGLARFLERFAYRYSDHIIALSPSMTETIIDGGIDSSKITTITNSSNVNLFGNADGTSIRQKLGIGKHQHLVVYTGTFGKLNGVKFLIDLATELSESDVSFLLVGGGAEYNTLCAYAKELDVLNKNVFIWDRVPKTEIPEILAASTVITSVFLPIPEMWKNSANKFFDGLAAGKPIGINYYGWQADLLEKYHAGFVLNPHDVKESALFLNQHLQDKAWLKDAGTASRWLAENVFNFDLAAKELEKVLHNIV